MAQTDRRSPIALLVEDDSAQREIVATLLGDIGMSVIECASAEAATLVLDRTASPVALLFVDVRLAGEMSGIQLAEAAKHCHPEVSVIITSGRHHPDVPMYALFLPKPWQVADILAAAENALTHSEPYSDTADLKAMRDETWAKLAWSRPALH